MHGHRAYGNGSKNKVEPGGYHQGLGVAQYFKAVEIHDKGTQHSSAYVHAIHQGTGPPDLIFICLN